MAYLLPQLAAGQWGEGEQSYVWGPRQRSNCGELSSPQMVYELTGREVVRQRNKCYGGSSFLGGA